MSCKSCEKFKEINSNNNNKNINNNTMSEEMIVCQLEFAGKVRTAIKSRSFYEKHLRERGWVIVEQPSQDVENQEVAKIEKVEKQKSKKK